MFPPTVLNRMDRNTATPRVPPIWRKNVAELVATPISDGGTALCMISSSGCMQLPSPTPSTSMKRSMTSSEVSAEVVESSSRAITRSAEPTRGKTRVRPVREMILPETMAPDIMPSTIGSISSPAMVGDAPCTICM